MLAEAAIKEQTVEWANEVINTADQASDEVVMRLLVGIQTIVEDRNRATNPEDSEEDWCPWATLRANAVGSTVDLRPARLALRWHPRLPESYGGAVICARGSRPQPQAVIYVDTNVPDGELAASLTHELVHWERGVQQRSVEGWERDEEERVVRAITEQRMAGVSWR